jgi:hypothetical protein
VNGASKTIACGGSDCVGGTSYQCGTHAELAPGGTACTTATKDAGGNTTGPAATTVDCPNAKGATDGKCDATREFCILAKNGGSAALCAPFPSGCSDCACASDNADAAWKAGNNGTSNCGTSTLGTAIVTCHSSNGAVTVTCDN